MKAEFTEVRAARLRLVVIDHRNRALDVRSVKYSAPARQVVFARLERAGGDVRLYFGNPKAEAPHYDFAGNLPKRLEPAPVRATLGPRLENPRYVPEPMPFTERWPWAIYVVLCAVSLVLAGIIFSVARTAIEVHDAAEGEGDAAKTADSATASPFRGSGAERGGTREEHEG